MIKPSMLTERDLTPAKSEDERLLLMAMRIGKYEAMLRWMAEEGRLKNHEKEILKEELSKNLLKSDQKHLSQIH